MKHYALAGNLYAVDNLAFLWNFPAKTFNLFQHVYIMTYLFDGQVQKYYYDLHGVQYEYKAVEKHHDRGELVPKFEVVEDRSHFKQLINIYEGKLNEVGDNDYSLSKQWFRLKITARGMLKNNLYNYFRHIQKAKSEQILWTTFKDYKGKIQGGGFSKEEPKNADKPTGKACFTAFTLRATNAYKHMDVLAYCLNRFMNPLEERFFHRNDVKVDEDLLALSDLLQWVFRSAVREGQPVDVYIPSKRMGTLLKAWLDGQI